MRTSNPLILSVLCLAQFVVATYQSFLPNMRDMFVNEKHLTNAISTTIIPIYCGQHDRFCYANLVKNPDDKNSTKDGRVAVALYTSKSYLGVQKCFDAKAKLLQGKFEKKEKTSTQEYLLFTLTGKHFTGPLYLPSGNWKLADSEHNNVEAETCTNKLTDDKGVAKDSNNALHIQAAGSIGLGHEGDAQNNFINAKIKKFAIYTQLNVTETLGEGHVKKGQHKKGEHKGEKKQKKDKKKKEEEKPKEEKPAEENKKPLTNTDGEIIPPAPPTLNDSPNEEKTANNGLEAASDDEDAGNDLEELPGGAAEEGDDTTKKNKKNKKDKKNNNNPNNRKSVPADEKWVLLFDPNLSPPIVGKPVVEFHLDQNWQVRKGKAVMTVGSEKLNYDDKRIIFDLASRSIGFPSEIFKGVIEALKKHGVTECVFNPDHRSQQCLYDKDDTSKLPEIHITISNQEIILSHYDYSGIRGQNPGLKKNQQTGALGKGQVLIHIVETNPASKDIETYVNDAYADCIILGQSYLSNYLNVFDVDRNSLTIYKPPKPYVVLDEHGHIVKGQAGSKAHGKHHKDMETGFQEQNQVLISLLFLGLILIIGFCVIVSCRIYEAKVQAVQKYNDEQGYEDIDHSKFLASNTAPAATASEGGH